MAKRQENILDYLDKGTSEDITVKDDWNHETECVRVKVGDFEYTYPKYDVDKYGERHDFRPELKKRWDAENRRESHFNAWGCNYSHPSRVNDDYLGGLTFGQNLKFLSENRQIASQYYAVYKEACKAPTEIQQYVYNNLLVQLRKDKLITATEDIKFDTIERMPKAFREGWEKVDLGAWDGRLVAEDLRPASGFEIGKKCYVKLYRHADERTEGTIIGYKYELSKNGMYHIMYEVKTSSWGNFGTPYRLEEIHFSKIAA